MDHDTQLDKFRRAGARIRKPTPGHSPALKRKRAPVAAAATASFADPFDSPEEDEPPAFTPVRPSSAPASSKRTQASPASAQSSQYAQIPPEHLAILRLYPGRSTPAAPPNPAATAAPARRPTTS